MKKVRKSEGTENELGVRGRVGSGHPEAETWRGEPFKDLGEEETSRGEALCCLPATLSSKS